MRTIVSVNEVNEGAPSAQLGPLPSWPNFRRKRDHTKSRNGCITCKLRRVKCDETLPRCQRCTMRGIDCRYAESNQSPGTPSRICSAAESSSEDLPTLTNRAPDSLLWQYYLVHASSTMVATSTDPAHARMWESALPAIAFGNPVASHALMAFSAFCLSSTTCCENTAYGFQATAVLHYCQALKYLRALLPVLDQIGADAVLACAMVMIPCGLTLAQSGPADGLPRDWLHHLRGFRTLGSAIYDRKGATKVKPTDQLIPYPQPGIPDAGMYDTNFPGGTLREPAELLFHRVRHSQRDAIQGLGAAMDVPDIDHDVADIEACAAAFVALEYAMNYTLDCRVSNFFRAVFTWPILISPRYVELLARHDHLAHAIYAHWLVLTMLLEDLWWVRDFGSDHIGILATWLELIRSPYSHVMRWPVKMRSEWRDIRAGCQ